jgi:hypothetical protein
MEAPEMESSNDLCVLENLIYCSVVVLAFSSVSPEVLQICNTAGFAMASSSTTCISVDEGIVTGNGAHGPIACPVDYRHAGLSTRRQQPVSR